MFFLPSLPRKGVWSPFFLSHLLMIFFINLGDSVMSYIAPVIMEREVGLQKMGFILATSSMMGMVMDVLFARLFPNKRSLFFKKILVSIVLFFPISLCIYQMVPSFLFGMVVWGIYFESIVFSNFHVVQEHVHPSQHIWAWSLLSTNRNLTFVIGPLLASYTDAIHPQLPLVFAGIFFGFGILQFVFQHWLRAKRRVVTTPRFAAVRTHGFKQELPKDSAYIAAVQDFKDKPTQIVIYSLADNKQAGRYQTSAITILGNFTGEGLTFVTLDGEGETVPRLHQVSTKDWIARIIPFTSQPQQPPINIPADVRAIARAKTPFCQSWH